MNALLSPLEVFRAKGIPHRRVEDWKYSDLRTLIDASAVASTDGVLWRIRNLPKDVERVSITEAGVPAWAANLINGVGVTGAMDAAARAFVTNGVALRISAGAQVSAPIDLELRACGHGQIILVVEKGASATLMETHYDDGDSFRNLSTSIFLEEGARLIHIRQAPFARELINVESVSVVQAKDSHYRVHLMEGGSKLSRVEFNIALKGEGAEVDLSGISVLGDHAHADITTHIDHTVPNTTSRQLFKKIAGGHSRAIYQGKITVREGAIGSDSRQTAKALLLSARAEADLKPELEILADDVKCAHGAAVGDLDADSLFYLRSRGVPEDEARGLLIRAFMQEVLDGIESEGARASAAEFIDAGLVRAMGPAP